MSDAFYNALCDHQHLEGYEEGYKDGYEAGKRDAASPWHRVEERPDEHTNLWLHDERGNYHVGCISTYRGYTEYIDMDGNTLHDIDYWMPIEPPKEDA